MKKVIPLVFTFVLFLHVSPANQLKNEVNLVFCLDMSGSTNGIIPDFKTKIWEVINGIHKMRPYPNLKIGIIGFSRPSFGKNNGYVKVFTDLTENFDQIAFELNKLKPTIEKGDQFVGAALLAAEKMNWSTEPKALRIIYLMGNGTVNAGGFDYRRTCEDLLKKNIFVNSIYCIQQKMIPKEIAGWKFIADNTGGTFFTYKIDHIAPLYRISNDAQTLISLNESFNSTYVYYGPNGKVKMDALTETDKSCLRMGENYFYSRLLYKSSSHFQSGQVEWDLINYIKAKGIKLDMIDKKTLVDSLKTKDTQTLKAIVISRKDERSRLVSEIRSHFSAIGFDTILSNENKLQGIILNSVKKLARDKGIQY